MATLYWTGTADTVQQVWTGSIDSLDGTPANNTFTVTIGGVAISQAGTTDVGTTAAALVVLLNASTHPYFSTITWTNPSAGNIVGTADTAGVAFVAALTETGAGTGAVTDFAVTTANAGPNDWSTTANWSTGTVPTNSDVVIIANNSVPICWGLAQTGVTLTSLRIDKSYTGKIGLPYTKFATNAAASTFDTSKTEYRAHYLAIKTPILDIGEDSATGSPAGSGRLKIDTSTTASQITIYDTATTSADGTGTSAVRLKADSSTTDIYVRLAPGGVSIAGEVPGETSTVGDVNVSEDGSSAQVYVGSGVTLTNYIQRGGTNVLDAAATVTAVTVDGGTLTVEGDYTITTLTQNDGLVIDNHIKTSGNAITTANLKGGTTDWSRSLEARVAATVNLSVGATFVRNSALTITTLNEPAELCTVTVSR